MEPSIKKEEEVRRDLPTKVYVDNQGNERIISCGMVQLPNGTLNYNQFAVLIPRGSIKKLIGRELKFGDEPVTLKPE